MTCLFEPFSLRSVVLRNRVAVSPMCQYSAVDGLADEWHLVHLGSRAVGGAGLVVVEATGVEARGRISPGCLGIWSDAHAERLARVARFVEKQGAVPGIQLAHAGRKASTGRPWDGGGPVPEGKGGWPVVGASPIPFAPGYPVPAELDAAGIAALVKAFADGARRAREAGFRLFEVHGAHGYLGHSFLSPLSNRRTDAYGGALENRARFVRECTRAVRAAAGDGLAVSVRLSCTDWTEGGLTLEETVTAARWLREDGADVIDCSSGGNVHDARIPAGPGYQVPFARAVRAGAQVPTIAVGMITEPAQAEEIVASGAADLVMLARAELRDPYWPIHAAQALGAPPPVPPQYERGFPPRR